MSLLELLFGRSKKKLHAGILDELCFDSRGIKGRLVGLPYFFDPVNPERKIQDADFALDLAVAITNFEPAGEERLFDSLQPFRNYHLELPGEGGKSFRLEFRIERKDDASTLLMALLRIIDEALQSAHLSFHRLRE
jgi:hypothetical protein